MCSGQLRSHKSEQVEGHWPHGKTFDWWKHWCQDSSEPPWHKHPHPFLTSINCFSPQASPGTAAPLISCRFHRYDAVRRWDERGLCWPRTYHSQNHLFAATPSRTVYPYFLQSPTSSNWYSASPLSTLWSTCPEGTAAALSKEQEGQESISSKKWKWGWQKDCKIHSTCGGQACGPWMVWCCWLMHLAKHPMFLEDAKIYPWKKIRMLGSSASPWQKYFFRSSTQKNHDLTNDKVIMYGWSTWAHS